MNKLQLIIDNKTIIFPESDEAAKIATVTGWVDVNGRFWGHEEEMARWSGATHLHCKSCGKPIGKRGYTICSNCRNERDKRLYLEYKQKAYDGSCAYSDAYDRYFENPDEIEEYMFENNLTWDDLRMCATTANYLRPIDDDHWYDTLAEDSELPKDVKNALAEFNKVIDRAEPVSYSSCKVALSCTRLQGPYYEKTHT